MKKKKKKKVLSKLDGASKDEKPTSPQHHDAPDDAEGERIIRKSTRTSVIVRQAERDAIRAALQATMKASFGYCILSSFVGKYCSIQWFLSKKWENKMDHGISQCRYLF